MKMICDVPDEVIKSIKDGTWCGSYVAEKMIANGIPLPKGHGRLIDAEKLECSMYHEAFETDSDLQKWDSGCWIRYKMFEQNIQKAETIIEKELESGV
jgi:hypothetical protein